MMRILKGDALSVLRTVPEASFDAAFCDPPYHLTTGKRGGSGQASENLKHPGGRSRATTGFMGKAWDGGDVAFRPETWVEVLRVLKPGAPLLAFGGTRTFHRLACAIEDGGFILADTLCWLHGQGFPKGHAQLKPAWEPITLAWKKGPRVLAIDAGRIPANGDKLGGGKRSSVSEGWDRPWKHDPEQVAASIDRGKAEQAKAEALGRWPANVLLDEEAGEQLDAQSGDRPGGAAQLKRRAGIGLHPNGSGTEAESRINFGDSGGASRFFYCAKASRSERGEGNTHPTVKPLKLCEYLARLILPPTKNPHLVVPFAGSMSEVMGGILAGWKNITAIEREVEYCRIGEKRIADLLSTLQLNDKSDKEISGSAKRGRLRSLSQKGARA